MKKYSSHIERFFRQGRDDDLRQWFISQINNGNAIGLIRNALECYRLFDGSLERAREAARALAFVENGGVERDGK